MNIVYICCHLFRPLIARISTNVKIKIRVNSCNSWAKLLLAMRIKVLIFIQIFLLTQNIWAQNLNSNISGFKFERIQIGKQFSQDAILSIVQDNQGFIWFGTEGGLCRYDGYDMKIFHHDAKDSTSLSNDVVNVIFEDKNQNLWIGTNDGGLNLFNASSETFTHFQHNKNDPYTISSNSVTCMIETGDGKFWIGTAGKGINLFDPKTKQFKRYMLNTLNSNSLADNLVNAICLDKNNVLWLGTNNGLERFDTKTEQYSHFVHDDANPKSLLSNTIRTIFIDSHNNFWLGTMEGAILFDETKNEFTNQIYYQQGKQAISKYDIYAITEDNEGNVWIGSNDGLYIYDPVTKIYVRYIHNQNDTRSLSHTSIRSISFDKSGKTWIGTFEGGINKYDRKNNRFAHFQHDIENEHSISSNTIRSLYFENADILWIGNQNKGLDRFDRKSHTFKHFIHQDNNANSLTANDINAIYKDKSGVFWIGTVHGISKVVFDENGKGKFTNYLSNPKDESSVSDNVITCFLEDSRGWFWVGTQGGLNKYDRQKDCFERVNFVETNVNRLAKISIQSNSLKEDNNGNLWIGTWDGLFELIVDAKNQTYKSLEFTHDANNPYSLTDNRVITLCKDQKGTIWAGTCGGGFCRVENQKTGDGKETIKFYAHTSKNGLPNGVIYGLLSDEKGNIWASTNNGLSEFDPQTAVFRNYGVDDGLQHEQFYWGAVAKSPNGEMAFGGINGLNIFYPDSVHDRYVAPAVINDIQIFNKDVQINEEVNGVDILDKSIIYTDRLTLSYRNYVVTFKFATLDFVNSPTKKYAYILEGFEKEWNRVDNNRRFATYTSLPPGNYTFRVKGSNRDGLWNEVGRSIKITVLPPFWQTWWMRTLIVLLVSGLIVSFYLFRIKQINAQKVELEHLVIERTQEIRDINEELHQQKEVIEAQATQLEITNHELEKLSFVASHTDNAVSIMDSEGNVEWVNDGFAKLYEYSLEDFHTAEDKNLMNTIFNADIKRLIDKCRKLKKSIVYEMNIETRSGNKHWVQTNLIPILDSGNNIHKLISIDSDITELKTAHFNIEIQKKEIMEINEILELQKEELIEADKTKSRFFTSVSHEFRTPLSLIIGPLTTLMSKTENEDIMAEYKLINKHATKLLNLVNQLLDLAKLQNTKIKLYLANEDINSFLRNIIHSFSSLAEELHVQLFCKIEPQPLKVWFDKDKLEKIIMNLISNAVKHTPKGGYVEMKAEYQTTDSDYMEISVIDSGTGIEANDINKIFEPFYQTDSSINRKIKGSGIGLALVKELALLHGGTVSVTSEVGKGSTFTVKIAVKKEMLPHAEIIVEEIEKSYFGVTIKEEDTETYAEIENKAPRDKATVLIVEDHDDMRQFIAKSIQTFYYIAEASNGLEGYGKAVELSPDLIISDVMMPQMDGYEMTRLIKNDKRICHIPVILLTAKASDESKIEGLKTAADDYLTKPFNLEELMLRIKNAISNRQIFREKFQKNIIITPSEITATSLDEQFLTKALQVVENNIDNSEFTAEDFCREIAMSRSQVHLKLKALTNQSATEFIRSIRLKRAASLILQNAGSISEVAYQTGFNNHSYFSKCFKEQFGVNPNEYKRS